MKAILSFFFLMVCLTSYCQSAKKLNKELRAQLLVEQQKQDSLRLLFQEEKKVLELEQKQLSEHVTTNLYYKDKELRKLRTGIYMTLNTIKDLELNADDVFPAGVNFNTHPKYKSFMMPLEEPLGRLPEFQSVRSYAWELEKQPKTQNELLKSDIEKYQAYAAYNLIYLQDIRKFSRQIQTAYPSVDSLSGVYQSLINDLQMKTDQLYQKVHAAEENYRKKGPDGFPISYGTVFPTIHPVPQTRAIVAEIETGGEFVSEEPVFNKYNVFELVDEPAAFSGGEEAFKKFLKENVFYPSIAKEKGISGTTYLKFIVSATGEVSNVTVEKGIPNCYECDMEARRAIRLMPDWIPAKKRGKTVHSYVTLPIQFKP